MYTRAKKDREHVRTDFGGLGSGEEHGLAIVVGENLDNLSDFVLETDFENTVGLVDNQRLEVLEDKGSVEEVVKQAARRGNKQIDTLGQLLGFGSSVGAAHDDAVGLGVVLHEFAGDTENLEGQLSGGRDDNDTGTVPGLEAQRAENLDSRNQKGKCFTGTSLGGTENILAGEQWGNSLERCLC